MEVFIGGKKNALSCIFGPKAQDKATFIFVVILGSNLLLMAFVKKK